MVTFTKVRLSGFKSFVDATELIIEPGLTGIVGPNGCGKSNLLEALRWCMGESSAKKMRGGEMDDVIFNGTAQRPARNLAEVTIALENKEGLAPAAYNEFDEIEIVRRIERGSGSHYKVNGRDVRARDVQLLFADLSTGARSTAIVSQGRVGALINAKPAERRMLLEEAAGISGLHTRRHEAELRLRAAENNLARLDDVVQALAGQLQGLKRQARQASRYRNIGDHIRRSEAILLHLKWETASRDLEQATARLREAEARVRTAAERVAAATNAQSKAAVTLPEIRKAEGAASSELQRLVLAREALDAEEAHIEQTRNEYRTRLTQLEADLEREKALIEESKNALERLDAEQAALTSERDQEVDIAPMAEALGEAESALAVLEEELSALTTTVAEAEAERSSLAGRITELQSREEQLVARQRAVTEELAGLGGAETEAADAAESAAGAAEDTLERLRAAADGCETATVDARAREADLRGALQGAQEVLSGLRAEAQGLHALDAAEQTAPHAVVEQLQVQKGYEIALVAALGDDLRASTDGDAPVRWTDPGATDNAPPLPEGAKPLSGCVEAPTPLRRRLDQVGVVDDDSQGAALAPKLAQGQRLVTKAGALWRWDGYFSAAGATDAASERLRRRNRLDELAGEVEAAEAAVAQSKEQHEAAKAAVEAAVAKERDARAAAKQAANDASAARSAQASVAKESAARTSRKAALEESAARVAEDLGEVREALATARTAMETAGADEAQQASLAAKRDAVQERRDAMLTMRAEHDRHVGETSARERRLEAIGGEREAWRQRAENGDAQITLITERLGSVNASLEKSASRPKEIAELRVGLVDSIADAEGRRKLAADTLREAESALSDVDRGLKVAEAELADAREDRARVEGAVGQADQARKSIDERIRERLSCPPATVLETVGVDPDSELPALEDIERKLERLIRERDNMGPVNLRAEKEAEELTEQITSLEAEREDLLGAIDRFRKAINELNREGRDRLLASFTSVDTHFQELFTHLFGGGRAHLKLVESDDPLEAGLEIMASPPGKRLQTMSLLSGGEQALTALSLLFAVFLTNPAPICVLDEVDAPLDDANVDRFCRLLDRIHESTRTRFLLITHHRLTMARMDRLFGVTMGERGVSQLVSVDLQEAERLRTVA